MINIQTFQDTSADFSQTISLDGSLYNLRMTWNTRVSAWFFDIQDKDRNDVLLGLRLVPGVLLIKDYVDTRLPPGDFLLWDALDTPETYGVNFDNLGSRYLLIYLTEEEVEAGVEAVS